MINLLKEVKEIYFYYNLFSVVEDFFIPLQHFFNDKIKPKCDF